MYMPRKSAPVDKPNRRPTFIRAWRKHRGLSLEALAERVDMTHASLSRIERGEQPYNQDLLEVIAEALNCEVPDLLMRNPTDPEGMWSIWEKAKPGEKQQIVEVMKVIIGGKTGTGG